MKPVTVTQLTEYISKKLKDDYNLRELPVEGEVSGFSKSGQHFYFSLKDSNSLIRCAIWGSYAKNIDMSLLQDGKKIVAIGDISPYSKNGSYSFSIKYVEDAGEGDLMAAFNRIKEKLEKEGLFDQKFKKEIPQFPYRIGVITSNTGAAIEDIKKIITQKNDFTDVIIFPTQVQGLGAPISICENIVLANRISNDTFKIDTLIVGRGGGSAEDLAAFNDEEVARTIFSSKIPIISAVGHESDFSISDFVADKRAETPTAAANMAVMDTFALRDDINSNKKLLYESIASKLSSEHDILKTKVDYLYANMKSKITEFRSSVEKAIISINENNPERIFEKGYSAVMDDEGNIISDIEKILIDEIYNIKIKNGTFKAKVIEK